MKIACKKCGAGSFEPMPSCGWRKPVRSGTPRQATLRWLKWKPIGCRGSGDRREGRTSVDVRGSRPANQLPARDSDAYCGSGIPRGRLLTARVLGLPQCSESKAVWRARARFLHAPTTRARSTIIVRLPRNAALRRDYAIDRSHAPAQGKADLGKRLSSFPTSQCFGLLRAWKPWPSRS